MNPAHILDAILVIGYLLLVTAWGRSLGRHVRTGRDYFLAGGNLGWVVAGLSIVATHVSVHGIAAISAASYSHGITLINFMWIGAIPGMILAALYVVPVLRRAGVHSLPAYLGLRYTAGVRLAAAWLGCALLVFMMALSFWALGALLSALFGIPAWAAIVITGALTGWYVVSGGMVAATGTDVVQAILILVAGAAVAGYGIGHAGGMAGFLGTLASEHARHTELFLAADHAQLPWTGILFGLALVLSPAYWCGNQAVLQRTLAARSGWDARAAMLFAAAVMLLMPALMVVPGLVALTTGAPDGDAVLPWMLQHLLPPGLSGLLLVALLAALQSTVDSATNSGALMITRDIRRRGGLSEAQEAARARRWARVVLLLGMAGALLMRDPGDLLRLLVGLAALFQGPMLALIACGMLTRWATPASGMFTLLSGLILAGLLTLIGMPPLHVAATSFVFSLAVLISVSRHTPRLADHVLDRLVHRHG